MAPGSRTSLVNVQPMPRIVEDDDSPPPTLPEKSYRRSHLGKYPPYTASTDSTYFPDRRESIYNPGWKEQPWFTRRGGWCRLLLIFLLFASLAAGLAVGLTIGLRHSSDSDNSAALPPPASSPAPDSLFPAGSYSFTTALTSVSTACTSNSAAFRCYPYTIYDPTSPDASAATFTWVIATLDSVQYVISSAPNPFAPQFTNITMTMLDAGEPSERFAFNYTMPMQVVPATPLVAGQDATSTCWYNSTVLSATLWTRQRATYPANITSAPAPVSASTSFTAWPYAVEIREVQAPEPGVPDCLSLAGEPVGNSSSSFAAQNADNADVCGCWYSNFQVATNATAEGKRKKG